MFFFSSEICGDRRITKGALLLFATPKVRKIFFFRLLDVKCEARSLRSLEQSGEVHKNVPRYAIRLVMFFPATYKYWHDEKYSQTL